MKNMYFQPLMYTEPNYFNKKDFKMTKMLKILGLSLLGILILSTATFAKQVRNDMPFICKYEAKRNYGLAQGASETLPVEKTRNGFVVYGQSPRNTSRALFFECKFDRRGEYIGISKSSDKRYAGGGNAHNGIPKVVRRVCKGEASARWRMRPNEIRINNVKRMARDDYMVKLSARNYRGKCEVSKSGHIYLFQTKSAGNSVGNNVPREAKQACKRRAASRWGKRPDSIRVNHARRVGRDDYIIKLSYRDYRVECEVSGRGRIYNLSEY